MKGYITASVILGAAAIFSSLIISGNISFKDEHIIQLSGGAIKLGDVYKENKLISAKIIFQIIRVNRFLLSTAILKTLRRIFRRN